MAGLQFLYERGIDQHVVDMPMLLRFLWLIPPAHLGQHLGGLKAITGAALGVAARGWPPARLMGPLGAICL